MNNIVGNRTKGSGWFCFGPMKRPQLRERKKIEMRSHNNALPPEEKKYNTPYVVKYKKKKGLG